MFGDLILWIKEHWKQFWCIHDYQWQGKLDFRYCACTKCGKSKGTKDRDLSLIYYILLFFMIIGVIMFISNTVYSFIQYGII